MNEKLTKAPDGGRSIKKLYLDDMMLFEYDARDKKRWTERAVARKKPLV